MCRNKTSIRVLILLLVGLMPHTAALGAAAKPESPPVVARTKFAPGPKGQVNKNSSYVDPLKKGGTQKGPAPHGVAKPVIAPTKAVNPNIKSTLKPGPIKAESKPKGMQLKALKAPGTKAPVKTAPKAALTAPRSSAKSETAKTTPHEKGAKAPARSAKKGVKTPRVGEANQDKALSPKTTATSSSSLADAVVDEGSGIGTEVILALLVIGAGVGGVIWNRKRQQRASQDLPIDVMSGDAPVSTFVSNLTATQLDSTSDMGTPHSTNASAPLSQKARRPPLSQATATDIPQSASQETPFGTSESSLFSVPPASGAPSQIVVPKKPKSKAS